MLGSFQYCNPTKLYFGRDTLTYLNQELPKYGPKVQLAYGGGSIKKSGLYDQVLAILKSNGKTVLEDGGVMPNPTTEKLYEGCRIAKENEVDLILAVGGGSVCDYAKAVSVSAWCPEDPWDKYYLRMEDVDNQNHPGWLRPHLGRYRQRDERWRGHHEPGQQIKDWSCFWRKRIPQILHPRPNLHLFFACIPDGRRDLRYPVPHSGAISFR